MEPAELLDLECRAFSRYLTGQAPSEAARAYYARAHTTIPYRAGGAIPVDRSLLSVARHGGFLLRTADGYSRFFRPTGPLRQKLVLCLAILENTPEAHEGLNSATVGSPVLLLSRLLFSAVASAAALGIGLLIFGPIQLVSGRTPDRG